jgi:hypothetical protein
LVGVAFLVHDEAAISDDVHVYLTAATVEHIRNSKLLDAGPEDEKAIEEPAPRSSAGYPRRAE